MVWSSASSTSAAPVLSLSGEGGEVATSDGEVRHFSPGGILLVEDTRGKGYSSRVGGETYGMAAIVQLAS